MKGDEGDIITGILRDAGLRGSVTVDSNIPIGKGLGSSAAAAVAALAIVAASKGESFDYDDILRQATDFEGHPDNAAPAIVGGLVAVVGDYDNPRVLQLPLSPDIGFVFAAPDAVVSTKAARMALPELIPHDAAARTIARTVALVEGLAEAEPELLRIGFNDELHVPFRLAMIPGGTHALDAALRAGAWAATISGSGSGVIAACERGHEEGVLAAMIEGFMAATEEGAAGFVAQPDFDGVRVERLA